MRMSLTEPKSVLGISENNSVKSSIITDGAVHSYIILERRIGDLNIVESSQT